MSAKALLLGRAEQLERLGDADGLVRRQQHADRTLDRGRQRHRPVVDRLREPQTSVLARDLDTEAAQLGQALDHVRRDLGVAVDRLGIDGGPEERGQLVQPGFGPGFFFRVERGVGVNEMEPEPAFEQLAHEARGFPFLLAGRFGHFASVAFTHVTGWGS
ncbi:MAG: hypothetical protein HYW06_10930 [Gemmatimonadetes bacterium]|nr:hypothetical protein [Gemmatimonadota bacterium]